VHLRKLKLFNFKNYADARVDLEGNIQGFFGKNGAGKTNLLDAIHYLSFTKSAINPSDVQNIRQGENQFLISGEFQIGERLHEVSCAFQQGFKKIMSEDSQPYARFSKHIGKYPVVMIAPNDVELIWDGSELRRRFFDNLLSQISAEYLNNLIIYTQYLKQRNGLLRIFSESGSIDADMLEAYDGQLIPAGKFIFEKRRQLMGEFLPVFEKLYRFLVNDASEEVKLIYKSTLESEDFAGLLKRNLSRDILLQRTGEGVHRDDFLFILHGGELRRLGSQGQQKSFLIALKLAEFQLISQHKGLKPLLLLDDVFDKLDDSRIHQLMGLVANGTFGQLLITDARGDRSRDILAATGVSAQLFEVAGGQILRL
jgi:DNA replication and repair protein RecF